MAITADRNLKTATSNEMRAFAAAAEKIYKGAFVGLNASTGYARNLVAGDLFLGVAYKQADNSGGSAGDENVQVDGEKDFEHALSGVALTDIGTAVYASDNGTLTTSSSGNSYVGVIAGYVSSGIALIRPRPLMTS